MRSGVGAVEVDDELGAGVHHRGGFSVPRVGVDVAVIVNISLPQVLVAAELLASPEYTACQ